MKPTRANDYADGAASLPARELRALLASCDDLAELKATLFCLAALSQKAGRYRYLRLGEMAEDEALMRGMAALEERGGSPLDALQSALRRAIEAGSLLPAQLIEGGECHTLYLANDEQGRALQARIQAGDWRPELGDEIVILPPRPSVFALYEENFGLLTPMIADALREAEAAYPRDWIEDAMRLAVERKARNWRYVSRVLEGWREDGRSHETDGRDPGRHQRFTAGKWKDYIKS